MCCFTSLHPDFSFKTALSMKQKNYFPILTEFARVKLVNVYVGVKLNLQDPRKTIQ